MSLQVISYDNAVLAKEKGYDQHPYRAADNHSEAYYPEYEDGSGEIKLNHPLFNPSKIIAIAPFQEVLRKWLREKHNIMINVFDSTTNDKFAVLVSKLFSHQDYYDNKYYDTYEEALEDGLQEALKQIKS